MYKILCYIVIKCYTINYYIINCIAVYRYNIDVVACKYVDFWWFNDMYEQNV